VLSSVLSKLSSSPVNVSIDVAHELRRRCDLQQCDIPFFLQDHVRADALSSGISQPATIAGSGHNPSYHPASAFPFP
jgi:hypothetical protein